jgi:N6-L-threonylcarbamoyladenine synthase
MIILGIETSCDDTCISIIEAKNSKKIDFNNFEVLANLVSSQSEIHSGYGGVFPALAKREHQKNLVPLLIKALRKSNLLKENKKKLDAKKILKIKKELEKNEILFQDIKEFFEKYNTPEINKIAVTVGPGLEPCLYTGTNLARALSFYWNIPLFGINHLEGHIFSSYLGATPEIKFPAICLIVSGGNTQIIYIKKIGDYKIIGETRDDAAGECFDKTARMLGLGYPGGPIIAKKAKECKSNQYNISLPRPMMKDKNYDFSFSGLKTAVLYDIKKRKEIDENYIQEMAFEIESSIIDVLTHKTIKAANDLKVNSIILGGGVSANKKLIKELKKNTKLKVFAPPSKFSGDNAAMIGLAAIYSPKPKKINWLKVKPSSNLKINE